jgi:membrane-associated phospholipid phosphatase
LWAVLTRYPVAGGGLPISVDSSVPKSKLLATARPANYFTLQSMFPLRHKASRMLAVMLAGTAVLAARPTVSRADDFTLEDVLGDAKSYFTAPLHWDGSDWLFFGGSLAAIAVAHDFDSRVRDHFAPAGPAGVMGSDTNSLRDAIPAASLVVGTWLIGTVTDDSFARTEAYIMLEAAGFSSITAEALKYAAGRERPDETTDSNDWRMGGSSFPSLHTTAAFAIGTVFAESGNDDYRWLRRALGYGMASATTYLRLHGNQHWLSDTVAGAAIGIASGRFSTHRRLERAHDWNLSVTPAPYGGVQLAFNLIVN